MTMRDLGCQESPEPCLGCDVCAGHAVRRAREIISRTERTRELVSNTRAETRRWLTWRDRVYGGEATG